MKNNLNAYFKTVTIWILQVQLFNLLDAKIYKDEERQLLHPIPGTDCKKDIFDSETTFQYINSYPSNATCTTDIVVCDRVNDKWGYVDVLDLMLNESGEINELLKIYEFAHLHLEVCNYPDLTYFCKTSNFNREQQLCLNDDNSDTDCFENDEPQ
ncbi:MAG: hypothetical protein MHPSP_004653, partial [Paramarteilia canceri]